MDLSTLRVDTARVDAGEWVSDIPGFGDIRLRVRGSNSSIFKDAQARAARAIPRTERNRDGSLPAAVAERVLGRALADGVLLEWENVAIAGEAVPYSKDKGREILTAPEWQIFRDAVAWAADLVAAGREGDEADALGKSPAP